MANTATALTPIRAAMSTGKQGFSQMTPVLCTFDTLASDLTVFTPALATNCAAIWAMSYAEASAHTVTLKSGTTTYVIWEMPANSGVGKPVGSDGFVIVGQPGEALKIAVGTAAISTMLLYCVEFPSINFHTR